MVGLVIECRLGNQLFQYAYVRGLSKKFHTGFFINKNQQEFVASEYFHLDGYNPVLNFINKFYFKIKTGYLTRGLQSVTIGTYHGGISETFTNNAVYRGYFQSDLFFKNIAGTISRYIRIKSKYTKDFNARYGVVFSKHRVIAVHVRRGDYQNLNEWWRQNLGSSDLTLPANYYQNSIEQIADYEKYRIIFVSDDINWVKSMFGHFKNAEFAGNDMIIDFQIIMNADVCVISHSSFSWWAAYLNAKKDKQIFCPQYWLGFKIEKEYPENIIPDGWKQIKVDDTQ